MSFHLLDSAKALITNELVNKSSTFLGESNSSISKAFAGIIPSLLGGIAHKASTNDGANIVANLAYSANNSGFLNNINGFFDNNDAGNLLNKGAGVLTNLFGEDKTKTFTNIISNFSGIKPSSSNTLLSMATPVVLAFLGQHALSNNINAAGLSSLLKDEKDNIVRAMPGGLNLSSIFHGLESKQKNGAHTVIANSTKETAEGGALQWLLPLLLLVLAALVAWYFVGKGCNSGKTVADQIDSLKSISQQSAAGINDTAGNVVGNVDSLTGDFMYNMGKMIIIDLPDGAGKLEVGENSTENKLYKFLMDRVSKLDTVKGNWFEFTNVHFKTGGTQLDSASMVQLKNIAAVTKAFPTAAFKIGGYTDNTGDSLANVTLSQKRADVVMAELKKLGTSPSAITGAKGYGPQWPLKDNATPEGRGINRRVAVNVKAK